MSMSSFVCHGFEWCPGRQYKLDAAGSERERLTNLTFAGGKVKDEGRIGDWSQVYSGRRFYPIDPRPEDLDVISLAVSLSNQARYAGHCRRFSVAEHTWLCSYLVPEHLRLEALMHDGPESIVTDMIRPVKRNLGRDNTYFVMERNIWEKAFVAKWPTYLALELRREVVEADVAILGLEKQVLHPRSDPWDLPFPVPTTIKIHCYPPEVMANLWLYRYCELTGEDYRPYAQTLDHYRAQDQEAFMSQWDAKLLGGGDDLPRFTFPPVVESLTSRRP